MSRTLITTIQDVYAAFGRGDVPYILSHLTEDVSWEFDAPAGISWSGLRHGPAETAGCFAGIAAVHSDPLLNRTEFLAVENAVAAFGRNDATVRATGVTVSTPCAHYFQFRDGKICRSVNYCNSAVFIQALIRDSLPVS